jgi:uncharacterized protein (TIGR00725 family)
MLPTDSETQILKYSICVSGAAAGDTVKESHEKAEELGKAVAKSGHILTTGATVGLPYFAARGAKKAGGMSIGFSPASSLREHMRKYRLPHDVFDFINFTGLNYVGRDLYLVQSSDAVITVGGRFGSLHELTSALEDRKPCGVLLGSGGTADIMPEIVKALHETKISDLIIYDTDPDKLVKKVIKILDEKYADVYRQIKKDEHWFLRRSDGLTPPRAG